MSFIFSHVNNKVSKAQINFDTDTFYLHLVTSTPTVGMTTVSELTTPAGGTYGPQILTSFTPTDVSNETNLLCENADFVDLTVTNPVPILGIVVCRRASGIPTPTDWVISYNQLSSPYTPNGNTLTIKFPTNGPLTVKGA